MKAGDEIPSVSLSALGFCGADDSVHPDHLAILSHAFPKVEFGVLFRPDKEGTPRYASAAWIAKLGETARRVSLRNDGVTLADNGMKLAAHLCGSRVDDLLNGNGHEFLTHLAQLGFWRVQINATAVNGVDTSRLAHAESMHNLWREIQAFPNLEFILQKNEETKPLWQGVEQMLQDQRLPNVAVLLDESKGTGVLSTSWPLPSALCPTGYAGGIGPDNVATVARDIIKRMEQQPATARHGETKNFGNAFWIDMESSLRSQKNGKDVFDLDKCYQVIETVCALGLMERPNYLTRP